MGAESERTEHQRHQAEPVEQQASRVTGQVEFISGELIELIKTQEQVEHDSPRLPSSVPSWPVSSPRRAGHHEHTAAHGPPGTYQREAVVVAAGRSKIHTCRTDDTGPHLPHSVIRPFGYGGE